MTAPDVFWLEEIIAADGFYRMVGADLAKDDAAQKLDRRYYLRRDPAVLAADSMVQALIGAVVEEMAEVATAQERKAHIRSQQDDDETQSDWDGGVLFGTEIGARIIARDIRALRPDDATAALQRMLREARNEGLEKAVCSVSDLTHWIGDDDHGTTLVSLQDALSSIRALKEQPE